MGPLPVRIAAGGLWLQPDGCGYFSIMFANAITLFGWYFGRLFIAMRAPRSALIYRAGGGAIWR